METLSAQGETTSNDTDNNGWSNFPPFNGQKVDTSTGRSEAIGNAPDYLSDIDPARRKEIVDTSAEMTRDIPGAVICGGNANRILYESYTGKPMFGVGKNDSDIYVPYAQMEAILLQQPEGYQLKHELGDDGQEKWIRPEEGYIVLTHSGEHIDVFGVDESHKSTVVELDDKPIRVQSLTDQINGKIKLMFETNELENILVDPVHNPDPISKYGVYAQRILEMADSEKGKAELAKHADELPENWRDTLEVMASKGKYGKQLDPEKRAAFQERMEAWKEIQAKMQTLQNNIIEQLKTYFESNHGKRPEEYASSLPSFVSDLKMPIFEAMNEASTSDDFIKKIISKMSSDEKKAVKNKIKIAAGGE